MELSNATLSPGVVVNNSDPQNLGRIKCIIVGTSDPNTMNADHLPWAAPLTCFGHQRVSKPAKGQKVWVLHDKNNYYEYYWLPQWEVNSNTEIVTPEDDYDVLVSRTGTGAGAQMFYTADKGFVTRIGSEVSTTMAPDNSIVHTDNVVESAVRDKHIYAGAIDGEYEPMVLGNKLVELLGNLESKLQAASQAAGGSMYTAHMRQPLSECGSAIRSLIDGITSQNCSVN